MHYLKMFFYYLILLIGSLSVGVSLLSLLYDVNIWWLKVLDFPRQQTFLISLLCLLLFAIINRRWNFWSVFFSVGLVISLGLQAYYIFPYTPLAKEEVAQADLGQTNLSAERQVKKARVSLVIANVYMKNRNAAAFLDIVERAAPDMILAMETDTWWENALEPLQAHYPYSLTYPMDNTYGMLLYSKHPLIEPKIMFLQHEEVPSFHTKIRLANGQMFYFHGVHPVPPVYSKHPDNKGEKEEELVEVGDMVAQHQMPVMVAGDFNDVAWSHTSRLFQIEGQLHDMRVGRCFCNSFDARSLFLRWPLDHVYVTKEFEALKMERLDAFGSDHFPIYVQFTL